MTRSRTAAIEQHYRELRQRIAAEREQAGHEPPAASPPDWQPPLKFCASCDSSLPLVEYRRRWDETNRTMFVELRCDACHGYHRCFRFGVAEPYATMPAKE